MAPAAAPMANHFRARAVRFQTLPPFAARRASSRDFVSVAVLDFSVEGLEIGGWNFGVGRGRKLG